MKQSPRRCIKNPLIRTTFAFLKILKFDGAIRPALDYQQESQYLCITLRPLRRIMSTVIFSIKC